MDINIGIRPTGHITMQKRKRSGVITEEREFDNIVLDVGWDNLEDVLIARSTRPVPEYLYLGTGTTEPQPTDAGLESVSGTLPAKHHEQLFGGDMRGVPAERYAYVNLEFSYGEGEAEGVWTELGLSFDNAYTKPYNRSLIRDENGNPDSLTILSDEFLTVYVQLRMYFPDLSANPVTGSFDYNGTVIGWSLQYGSYTPFASLGNGSSFTFWNSGFQSLDFLMAEGGGGLIDGSGKGFSHVGPGVTFETNEIIENPGSEIRYGMLKIQPYWFDIVFDSEAVIPSTHKATFNPSSITFSRA